MSVTVTINKRTLRFGAAILAGTALLGVAGLASAHPGPVTPGVIHSCVNDRTKAIRIVGATENCRTTGEPSSRETPLDWSAQGPKGDKGDKGDAGATGPQGPQGPAGPPATIRTVVRQAVLNGVLDETDGTATADCVGSEVAVGGGFEIGNLGEDFYVHHSQPLVRAGQSNATGWSISAYNDTGATRFIKVYVVCAY